MQKRWCFPNKDNLFFQSQMDESKPPEEFRNWEHPPWYGRDQFEEKVTLTFLENQKGPFHNLKTHVRMPLKPWTIFFMSGNFIYRHHVEPRVKLYSPREESLPIPLQYTLTWPELHVRIWMSRREAHWWLLEHWRLSRLVWSLDRFHTIYSTRRKGSWRSYAVRGEIDEKTANTQARSPTARVMEVNGKEC